MSLIVLAIAAAHALPPIIGGVVAKRKGVIIGGVIGAAIAIATGNPVFVVSDLIGVAAGVWLGLSAFGKG